ncbi:MAG TPA: penicillin-binding transpeptidase domain-containing protein [Phycisphaerae bacterium]|nr:penicillin-binding transpeptidase domain-containing protein [Phycisphaerae bacterium]
MFETRLKVILIILAFAGAVIAARLFDMQVVHAEDYEEQAEDALLLPVQVLPAIRGRILDRTGKELVSDEPCWEIQVHYDALAVNTSGVRAWYRRAPEPKPELSTKEEQEQWFRSRIDSMWSELALVSGEPEADLRARGAEICDRVQLIRHQVAQRRKFDSPVLEEKIAHAVVTGLNDQQQVAARLALAPWPWVSVEDATQRVYHAGPAFAQLLGRMGPVTAENTENDPFADDDRRCYLGSERLGITGVERVAEPLLRGSRGRYRENRRGAVLEDIDAEPGQDVHLTVRADLQAALYQLFEEQIDGLPFSTGGAIVVLDVKSRDCLALVSYPGYDPNRFQEDYEALRHDTRRLPLRFRAVANQYAPGSIVKPLVCLAGLVTGEISLETHFECAGSLFPEHPDKWRCWPNQAGYRMHHGSLDVPGAIKHSCNVFMYHTGQLVGVERLTSFFDMAGLGRTTGTGLLEETSGINPTPSWLEQNRNMSPTIGLARLYAIGQGEVCATPIQAANLMATYASGAYAKVNLVAEQRDDRKWELPGTATQWAAIRRGLYGVVNDSDGTAHRTAYIDPDCGYYLCGKTGSAEVSSPWVVSYSFKYVDADEKEHTELIHASTKNDAIADFVRSHPGAALDYRDIEVAETWPDRPPEHGRRHSHAWFAGYLDPVAPGGGPDLSRTPPIAFAVLVEFGGSGGRVSAPIGRQVALKILDLLGPELNEERREAPAPKPAREAP